MKSKAGELLIKKLRRLRIAKGMTQEDVAEAAKMSYKHYQSIEAGRKPDIRISTVERLADALSLKVWELFVPEAEELEENGEERDRVYHYKKRKS